MRTLFFMRLTKTVGVSMVEMAFILMIAFTAGAWAGEDKKQTASIENGTDQVSAKDESQNDETSDDQEIICRMRANTGSKFKHKVCATKAQWAKVDSKNSKKTDALLEEVDRNTRTYTGPSTDGMGGQSTGSPR